MKFEVAIIVREQVNFVVEATSHEQATELAREAFHNGTPADELGNEWSEIEKTTTTVI